MQLIYVGFLIKSNMSLIPDFSLFMNDIKINGTFEYTQDVNKKDLPIEYNYNNSYIGGIQKLRIYDTSLSSKEILNNSEIDLNTTFKGGRIISS
jgi:allantoicase